MDASLSRRLAAEALGTGLLILFGPGSVVAALRVGDGDLDYAGLGMIGLSFGLVVALVIYAFGVPWLKAATGMPWADALAVGMTKFLVWDAAKLMIAAGIFPTAWWLIGRRPDDR